MARILQTSYAQGMKIPATVRNGKVVLDTDVQLPEGARVIVEVGLNPNGARPVAEVQFPLVRSKFPGSLNLSNQQIAELMDDEDISAGR